MVVMLVFGTRPEAIKMCPLVDAFARHPEISLRVCVTGQHREMLDQVLDAFGIVPDEDLAVMQPGQTINQLSGHLIAGLDAAYERHRPDIVLVHGDTTTCFIATLAAFHRKIPVGHVEAGLRTGNLYSPWPEEANRKLTAVLADLHFAPTAGARDNLVREQVPVDRIYVTGNTVIDALLWMRERLHASGWQPGPDSALSVLREEARMVLITGHRRESFGRGLEAICHALRRLAERYPDIDFMYPVHLNPGVQRAVYPLLGDIPNLHLVAPLDYREFVWAMDRSHLILTDSGGIQEEAPTLGKPVIVMRDNTERPEAQACGAIRVAGVTEQGLFEHTCAVLDDAATYQAMSAAGNPFGDGRAAQYIADHVVHWLEYARQAAA
ncbi:MAG: UDP-N-acetylglucosamine 2-epimerase (non-hydrolyzing) [Pseudazoarcus pumilus]|nr:UDP-N-acetylglucosamine 2-epimerase (non-hydrolyzing) [Pseudazoarcus pumilus]